MEYFKLLFKNFHSKTFVEKHFSSEEQKIIRDIKKTANNGPFIDSDISTLLHLQLKNVPTSDEELDKYVFIAIKGIGKGNRENIVELLKKKRSSD
ncbi:hypothetical protein [Chryseobacterium sp.]|uniref:hypothetical protein n=1 Tax=Chryseobacterium sp. TaxID=1871047 RepID=UPI0011CC07FA|nr:hypothetical protein [Chryseobacterium sp.]TXF75923.1 hypothetical protein FUA25_08440 [Chryseobacterium sp.]